MTLQLGGAVPRSAIDLVLHSGTETIVVLVVTAVFSLASWFVIFRKWWQLRRVRAQGDRFFQELERTTRLRDAYHAVMKLPPSPYHRIFREAINFFSELRPGALRDTGEVPKGSLSQTQLEALKMVLGKDIAAERDLLAQHIPWLATIGSVSPLLGLLGTVLGVMSAFIGIAAGGSGNIAAVAPGVAEALVTTVAGLATAIPAVMGYNIFTSRINLIGAEMEGFADELIGSMAREGLI
ncbi:MAG TPA: MotA/TolQ/ExbB proton channel family protein [Gemmatimonadales bacterium]|nr:MotA/TolQ/ExbB proton channel family protein [Gemmatimonadales bacterium]